MDTDNVCFSDSVCSPLIIYYVLKAELKNTKNKETENLFVNQVREAGKMVEKKSRWYSFLGCQPSMEKRIN
jgi:hypothetical protein